MAESRQSLTIGATTIQPGQRVTLELPVAQLTTHTPVTLPVHVVHGRREGPSLFVSAALHGDEINGVEIIRRVMSQPVLDRLAGTLIAVPLVNVFGFLQLSRYLPDRRDLNRSFPGSQGGSLAARLAALFMSEIASRCTHGLDLHTGAVYRENLPHVRADLSDCELCRLTIAFGAPVILDSPYREGTLRKACHDRQIPVIVYEAGEALRFGERAIHTGVQGVLRLMNALGMIRMRSRPVNPILTSASYWVRAPMSGILRSLTSLGKLVSADQVVGEIRDPLGNKVAEVRSRYGGVVIGLTHLPVINQGEALFHVAMVDNVAEASELLEQFQDEMERSPFYPVESRSLSS
ncbi:MAG: succinylglutamate desuccinylase/aspartoacylase family protein [Magnetococcales bacterium]|nr:succinylglutamate desuccinylase/aspartoacylase family protein [Magnetococcales bacterium]